MCTKYFIRLLKEELRENIKVGFIDIHIIDGVLIVDIQPSYIICFRYTDNKIMDEILIGKTVKEKTNEILKLYKKFLLSRYFTKKYLK